MLEVVSSASPLADDAISYLGLTNSFLVARTSYRTLLPSELVYLNRVVYVAHAGTCTARSREYTPRPHAQGVFYPFLGPSSSSGVLSESRVFFCDVLILGQRDRRGLAPPPRQGPRHRATAPREGSRETGPATRLSCTRKLWLRTRSKVLHFVVQPRRRLFGHRRGPRRHGLLRRGTQGGALWDGHAARCDGWDGCEPGRGMRQRSSGRHVASRRGRGRSRMGARSLACGREEIRGACISG